MGCLYFQTPPHLHLPPLLGLFIQDPARYGGKQPRFGGKQPRRKADSDDDDDENVNKKGGSEVDEDEDEDDDEEWSSSKNKKSKQSVEKVDSAEFDPEKLYIDDEDKSRLARMNEIERESLLLERHEQKLKEMRKKKNIEELRLKKQKEQKEQGGKRDESRSQRWGQGCRMHSNETRFHV
jgi:hypothetical protein